MKFGVNVLYKKLSNHWEFHENRPSENRTFIKSADYFVSAFPAIFRPR